MSVKYQRLASVPHTAQTARVFGKTSARNAAMAQAEAHSRFGCSCEPYKTILTGGRWKGLGIGIKADQVKHPVFTSKVPGQRRKIELDDTDPSKILSETIIPVADFARSYCSCQTGTLTETPGEALKEKLHEVVGRGEPIVAVEATPPVKSNRADKKARRAAENASESTPVATPAPAIDQAAVAAMVQAAVAEIMAKMTQPAS